MLKYNLIKLIIGFFAGFILMYFIHVLLWYEIAIVQFFFFLILYSIIDIIIKKYNNKKKIVKI